MDAATDRPLHVWCVNQAALPPDQPGGTRHVTLAKGMTALDVEMTIVAAPVHYASGTVYRDAQGRASWTELVDGVPFVWLAEGGRGRGLAERLGGMLRFGRTVARGAWADGLDLQPPDVVVGSSPSLFCAWGAARLARRLGVPFVLEVRDVWPQSIVDVAGVPSWHPGVVAMRGLERWLYRRAAHVVALLPGAAEHIAARGGHPDRITWVPNGVDLTGRTAQPVREAPDPLRVVYAGAHGPANALEAIIDAARLVHATHGDSVAFDFYGDGPIKQDLAAMAADVPTVTFRPGVPKTDVPSILNASDVLITNTGDLGLYRHGISPNKMFDYLASARPVVSGSAAPRDPIGESGGGLVVRPNDPTALADAVRQLAGLAVDERGAMGRRGRAFVETHHEVGVLASRLAGALRQAVAFGG